jgi:hypothetical protein
MRIPCGELVEVGDGFWGPGELRGGEVPGPGEVVDLVVAFGQQAGRLQPPEDVAAAVAAGQPDVLAGRQGDRAAGPVDLTGERSERGDRRGDGGGGAGDGGQGARPGRQDHGPGVQELVAGPDLESLRHGAPLPSVSA